MDIVTYTENLVKSIVQQPDMVKVQQFEGDEETILLEVIVHSDDMGAVIGRKGKMATSIRTLVQAYAYINNLNRVNINIDSF